MPARDVTACCGHCRHRLDDRRATEQRVAGLASFGSAYGASIAASRLCGVRDCWVSPQDGCASFTPKG
ncbi:hypothetical protein [Dyella sp. RRB7]|uniref:hypothetical protein n=1 Tax=Dyella sp. RRB7 TaxID=2919502 RepID=UPI001FAA55F7|nr:hypothetical protein [Dyella sp. RRB7]